MNVRQLFELYETSKAQHPLEQYFHCDDPAANDLSSAATQMSVTVPHEEPRLDARVYEVMIDHKWLTVIDAEKKSPAAFRQSLYDRFGSERVSAIKLKATLSYR